MKKLILLMFLVIPCIASTQNSTDFSFEVDRVKIELDTETEHLQTNKVIDGTISKYGTMLFIRSGERALQYQVEYFDTYYDEQRDMFLMQYTIVVTNPNDEGIVLINPMYSYIEIINGRVSITYSNKDVKR